MKISLAQVLLVVAFILGLGLIRGATSTLPIEGNNGSNDIHSGAR